MGTWIETGNSREQSRREGGRELRPRVGPRFHARGFLIIRDQGPGVRKEVRSQCVWRGRKCSGCIKGPSVYPKKIPLLKIPLLERLS